MALFLFPLGPLVISGDVPFLPQLLCRSKDFSRAGRSQRSSRGMIWLFIGNKWNPESMWLMQEHGPQFVSEPGVLSCGPGCSIIYHASWIPFSPRHIFCFTRWVSSLWPPQTLLTPPLQLSCCTCPAQHALLLWLLSSQTIISRSAQSDPIAKAKALQSFNPKLTSPLSGPFLLSVSCLISIS